MKLEIPPTVICACFILHNYCEKNKLYVDEEVVDVDKELVVDVDVDEEIVKSQIEILKNNEKNYKNISDAIFSFDSGKGTITRKPMTQYIKHCS